MNENNKWKKKRCHKEISPVMIKRGMSTEEGILDKTLAIHLNKIILKNSPKFKYYRKLEKKIYYLLNLKIFKSNIYIIIVWTIELLKIANYNRKRG